MPGCLSYVVAKDAAEADAIWITEIWDDASSHKASLQLPAVRAAIAKGRPLIAGFISALRSMQQEFKIAGEPDINVLARLPGAMQPGPAAYWPFGAPAAAAVPVHGGD